MTPEFFDQARPHQGMTYQTYLALLAAETEKAENGGSPDMDPARAPFYKINLQRTRRIGKTYQVSEDLRKAVEALAEPQVWMVLTEPWSGDSAQCVPYLAIVASLSDSIRLRILQRDQNLDIMDRYLTDGSRGIPMLVVFDTAGRELFRWGPRPAEAAELFRREKAAGLDKPQILEKLHLWYARNHGRAIELELLERLSG